MHRKFFNMIEIMLAMTVISIGFIGVIGLLPLGISTNRNAIENTYVTMASENMANYLYSEVKKYDYCYFRKQNITTGTDVIWQSPVDVFVLETETWIESIDTLPSPVEKEAGGFSTKIIPSGGDSLPNHFTMMRGTNPKTYLMKWETEINGVPAPDFECIVTIGLRAPTNRNISANGLWLRFFGDGYSPSPSPASNAIVRIEWPANASVEDRSYKEFFYFIY